MDELVEPRRIRLVAVGDELLTPTGDPRALGWLGRVLSKTPLHGVHLQPHILAVPGEGVEALSKRWEAEAAPRFGPVAGEDAAERHLLVALNDADLRTASSARARLNLANILDRASQQGIRCFVVGPVPGLDAEHNRRVAELNRAYRDVAERRGHPYVDAFTPLLDHAQWREDLTANAGHPGQAAFGLIAWLVLHRGWFEWLDITEGPTST
ncbi:GDSL-type esterase/lipase family protein [Nesterenkonia alkaliphila]|uniref:GDSL-type esterase/lipase family protein n=1 Tax=Nesterenkonia alkaliphila TaxID=1463631 RepID=UPI0012F7C61A|nr:GDSL-type esterase/lipase family protein [Nesterenkonia alkaliphila]GFZ84122.1 lysophospholipase [Nesterenkonia alkaliphila]